MRFLRDHLDVVTSKQGNGTHDPGGRQQDGEPIEPGLSGSEHGDMLAAASEILGAATVWGDLGGSGLVSLRQKGYAIFLPRVRGTTIGSCMEQYFPLL